MKTIALLLASVSASALLAQDSPKVSYAGALETTASYSGNAGIRLGQTAQGDIDSLFTRAGYKGEFNPGADVSWTLGVNYARWDFGRDSGTPLPANLNALTMPFGASWKINRQWTVFGELSPGFYTDFEEVRSEDFNAPFIGGVSYAFNQDLQVFFVVSVDGRRDVPVIGGPGLRWKFAEQWTLQLALPKPQIQYRPSERWTFHVGGELTGGAYHVYRNFGTDRGMPALDNQIVSYREIRAGGGVRWGDRNGLSIGAEAGWMIDRRFVFDDVNLQYNGDGALYGLLSLSYRY
jgi:hypothetical protein